MALVMALAPGLKQPLATILRNRRNGIDRASCSIWSSLCPTLRTRSKDVRLLWLPRDVSARLACERQPIANRRNQITKRCWCVSSRTGLISFGRSRIWLAELSNCRLIAFLESFFETRTEILRSCSEDALPFDNGISVIVDVNH